MFAAPHLHWRYWSRWGATSLARSHVLVKNHRIIAHAGALPLTCRAGGRALTLLHPFDWMSDPEAIGSGARLLLELARLVDGLIIVGGSEMTQRIAAPLGFRTLGEVSRYAAPLSPGAALDRDPNISISLTPRPSEEDCRGTDPVAPWLAFDRTPERLADYLSCPTAAMAVYTVWRRDERLGGFLMSFVPGQARVAASWSTSSRDHDRVLLARLARGQAKEHPGVDEVVCMTNDLAEQRALLAAGFELEGSVPLFLRTSARELDGEAQLRFQMLDGDVAFLHHGVPQPWLNR